MVEVGGHLSISAAVWARDDLYEARTVGGGGHGWVGGEGVRK